VPVIGHAFPGLETFLFEIAIESVADAKIGLAGDNPRSVRISTYRSVVLHRLHRILTVSQW
jgi:hypothetical protein